MAVGLIRGAPSVSRVDEHLDRWRAAGLLDEAQAERIAAFEAEREQREARESAERPSMLEAVLYLGVAVVAVGIVTLTAQNWEDLRGWTRIASLLMPGMLLLLFGQAMRAERLPAVQRASAVAWLVSVALLAGATGVIGDEAGWEGRTTALIAGAVATGLALLLWAVQPTHPQVIALAAALVFLAGATAAWPDDFEPTEQTAGLLVAVFGATGLVLAERDLFGPLSSARMLSAAGVMLGLISAAYAGGDDDRVWAEMLVFVAGAALVALSLRRSVFSYMVIAVGGTFIGLVAFIFRHFEDELGAPVALLLTGALVIAAALLLAHFRGRLRTGVAA